VKSKYIKVVAAALLMAGAAGLAADDLSNTGAVAHIGGGLNRMSVKTAVARWAR
jgi:hypothetical protein